MAIPPRSSRSMSPSLASAEARAFARSTCSYEDIHESTDRGRHCAARAHRPLPAGERDDDSRTTSRSPHGRRIRPALLSRVRHRRRFDRARAARGKHRLRDTALRQRGRAARTGPAAGSGDSRPRGRRRHRGAPGPGRRRPCRRIWVRRRPASMRPCTGMPSRSSRCSSGGAPNWSPIGTCRIGSHSTSRN